jgi:signal transduction histidine kinase
VRWRLILVDVLVAALTFTISAFVLAEQDLAAGDLRSPDLLGYGLLAVYSAAVVIRRAAPVAAVIVGLLIAILYAAADYPDALTPVVVLPIYTAAAVLPQRSGRVVLGIALVLGYLVTTLGPGPTDPTLLALILSAWLVGNYVGTRRSYTAELEHKNRLLQEAQRDLADRAVADERLRIARELHDVVAHTMGVVAVHAGAGRLVADDDPAAARTALATIETATRSAMVEMRRLLGVLRGGIDGQPAELGPAPGLGDLETLAAEVARSGVTVDIRVTGTPRPIAPGVDLSAYRIVQEALTNVIKHAAGSRAQVSVHYASDAVTVQVDNDGEMPARPAPTSPGLGLAGMRERVAVYNGEFSAGIRPDGGFRVVARLPLGEEA